MNIMSFVNKINAVGKYLVLAVLALNLLSLSNASSGLSAALNTLCVMSQQFLGIAVMVLIVLAGTVYAIGQVLGAETRARASVWATAMLTGAVIGVIIYIITPVIVRALIGSSMGSATLPGASGNPCQ
jgi:hypothetical protein